MKSASKLGTWLANNRASSRIAFGMRITTMGVGMVMSLFWQWAFVNILGKHVYGVLLSFQQVTRFAGVGDFGICGAIGLRTGQMLGRGEQDRLCGFLASARTLFLCIALVISCGFAMLSPWLPRWLGFVETPGAGPLLFLFAAGSFVILNNFINGYFASINNGCGTVMWPVLPVFLFSQLSQLAQYLAARGGAGLWVMVLVQAVSLLAQALFSWWMIRVSFRQLSRLLPLGYDLALWKELISTSGWVCLYLLGYIIYNATDNLLVNAGFGSGMVPAYSFNYKPIDMAVQVIISASFVSLAKINIWIADPARESQDRARTAVRRLGLFQSLIGTVGALCYLALDNKFIELWQGRDFQMSLMLQWAFALNLVVTAAGDANIQVAGVIGRPGLRRAGMAIGSTGVLNFILSFIAMRFQWLEGIAFATVVAQTILSFVLGVYICRHLQLKTRAWLAQSWFVPVFSVVIMAVLQYYIGSQHWKGVACLLGAAAVLIVIQARLTGVNREFIAYEWSVVRGILSRKKES